jgi:pimeloyl-ACP methyl ester carboxylesterase
MEYIHPQVNLQYTVEGKGHPVLFIHGFGENGNVFNDLQHLLKSHYKVYIIQLPGINGSGFNEKTALWNLTDYASLINDFIEEIIQQPVTVLGHSMGGYITLSLVAQHPDNILAFGLIHSTAFADSEEKIEAREKNIEFIEKYGNELFIKTTTPNLFSPQSQENLSTAIQEHIEANQHTAPEVLIAYTRAMIRREDHTALLKSTALPVLWIIGKHDQAVKYDDTLQQVYLPNISFVNILNNSGHMGMIEEPERVLNAVKEFLFYIYR